MADKYDIHEPRNKVQMVEKWFINTVIKPTIWFRKNYIEPHQKEYYWYHRQYRRVPTIDQCYTDDPVCRYEANAQYMRDRRVDSTIVFLLRERYESCRLYETDEMRGKEKCAPLYETYEDATTNFFIKYGDLKYPPAALDAYMKQKHRMIWERRHGEVGSGQREKVYRADGTFFFK